MADGGTGTTLSHRVIGVYEHAPLPPCVEVVKLLQVEHHPYGTGTATKRYYVLLVRDAPEDEGA